MQPIRLALSMYSCSMTLVTASSKGLPKSPGSTLILSSTSHMKNMALSHVQDRRCDLGRIWQGNGAFRDHRVHYVRDMA